MEFQVIKALYKSEEEWGQYTYMNGYKYGKVVFFPIIEGWKRIKH